MRNIRIFAVPSPPLIEVALYCFQRKDQGLCSKFGLLVEISVSVVSFFCQLIVIMESIMRTEGRLPPSPNIKHGDGRVFSPPQYSTIPIAV